MKSLLQLFVAQGTDSTTSSFNQARFKLVSLYLVILAIVISVFAYLVVLQVNQKIDSQRLRADSQIVLNANEALGRAQKLVPNSTVETTTYSLEDNTLLYKVKFSEGTDVEVNLLTGYTQIGDQGEHITTLLELLTDDVTKIIWWIAGGVFLMASIGSLLIAQITLKPIAISSQKQKRFVSDAAHELRNPLASLQMTLESFLRSSSKTPELTQSVTEDMLHEVKRLISTSESLLKLEGVEKRLKDVKPTDVSDVLNNVLKRLQFDLHKKSINVLQKISSETIIIDADDLDMILYNLLHNAIKFSADNTEITVEWGGKRLAVSDNGMGIAEKHLQHIFERFYKADSARSDLNSNGLGLALVSDIIHSYRGAIAVQSEPNKGSTFTIEL